MVHYASNKFILAYGSLRNKQYNFKHFKHQFFFTGEFEYIKTIPIAGYKMYSLGNYPMAIFTGKKSDIIICDILSVANNPYNQIYDMEIGAGYSEFKVWIETTIKGSIERKLNEYMRIFLFDNPENSKSYPVHSGDWVKYIKDRNNALVDNMSSEIN